MASLNAGSASKASCKVGHHDGAPCHIRAWAGGDPFAVLGVLHGLCEVRPDVVLGKGGIGVGELPVAHGLRFAFLRVLEDTEGSDSSAPSKNQRPQWCLNPAAMAMLRPACT